MLPPGLRGRAVTQRPGRLKSPICPHLLRVHVIRDGCGRRTAFALRLEEHDAMQPSGLDHGAERTISAAALRFPLVISATWCRDVPDPPFVSRSELIAPLVKVVPHGRSSILAARPAAGHNHHDQGPVLGGRRAPRRARRRRGNPDDAQDRAPKRNGAVASRRGSGALAAPTRVG